MKAQAAIEYLAVFGMALTLSLPFIMRAQSSIVDLRAGSEIVELENSIDKIESSVETVNAAGPPARRTFYIDVPEIVWEAEIVNGSRDSLVYRVRTADGESQLIRSFDVNLTGEVPAEEGKHRISVSAEQEAVRISVVD